MASVCGGNQVRSTKTSVSCLQSSMVVGVSWSGAAWVLLALGSYSSLREPRMPTCLKQSMIPFLRRLGHRAANLHSHTSCTLTTLHCSKVNFFQCCHIKGIIKYLQKCEGCTHFCEILYLNNLRPQELGQCFCFNSLRDFLCLLFRRLLRGSTYAVEPGGTVLKLSTNLVPWESDKCNTTSDDKN